MSTLLSPARSTKPIRRREPARALDVSLVLTINGQSYDVSPVAHAPGALKSYRLAKVAGDLAVYDLDAFGDRVACTCPSYLKTHEGTTSLCKHGKSLVTVGLVDYPDVGSTHIDEPTPDAYTSALAKMTALAEAELVVRGTAEGIAEEAERAEFAREYEARVLAERMAVDEPKPEVISDLPPTRVVAPFDAHLYACQNAVAERRALWLGHRHLHTSAPLPVRMTIATNDSHPAEPRLVDDDGTLLETSAEMDRRHCEEHAAAVAELLTDNPFLPTARQVEPIPCCEPSEVRPCETCATVHTPLHTLPDDLSGDDWQDEFVWNANDDAPAPDGWLPSADELHQAEEDGFFEQSYGEAPLAHATPECFAAVATGRADWAREFGYVPSPGWVTTENAEDLITDEVVAEGWGEYRDRERAEAMRARKAEMETKADEPEARTLEDQVLDHARELRAIGSPLHDLLAERAEQLAGEIRYLDATTVAQYRDRREAALDAARCC